MNDTWIFENGTWRNITSTAGPAPPAGYGMAMTYDPIDGYVLAYGETYDNFPGFNANDNWTFVHGKWNKPSVTGNITGGASTIPSFMVTYDSADSYVVATDGRTTYNYTGGHWALVYPGGVTPSNSTHINNGPNLPPGILVNDSPAGYVVYYGYNFTLKYAAGTWTNISGTTGTPPPV